MGEEKSMRRKFFGYLTLKLTLILALVLGSVSWQLINCGPEPQTRQVEPTSRERAYPNDMKGFSYSWKVEFAAANRYENIPEGPAPVGAPEEITEEYPDRLSLSVVEVDNFVIGLYEVRVKDFKAFKDDANGYAVAEWWSNEGAAWKDSNNISEPENWNRQVSNPNHPIVGVSYWEAEAFCNALGLRLPSEQEWEKAARGPNAEGYVPFPWGDDYSGITQKANVKDQGLEDVGKYEAGKSPVGCYDLVGNAHEWTSTTYGENQPQLTGNELIGKAKVCKGASYIYVDYMLTVDARLPLLPGERRDTVGFRVAADTISTVEEIPQLYHQDDWDQEASLASQ